MDISKLLMPPPGHDPSSRESLAEENDRLRRLLGAMVRSFNRARLELDETRESLGLNKGSLPFLQFPREVRDQIYLYALQAPVSIQTEPRPIACLHTGPLLWKPPTPGLCHLSRQVRTEANEVMYSKNTFLFSAPGELLRFEDQIGSNRDLVQRIEILTSNFLADTMMDPDLVAPCDYSAIPAHWIKTFNRSRLRGIMEMIVAGEEHSAMDDEWALMEMPAELRKAIEQVFARNRKADLTPRLTLKGFHSTEGEAFPKHWRITCSAGYFEPSKTLQHDS